MYPAPFNNQMTPQIPVNQMPTGKRQLTLWGIVVTIVAIILAALILIGTKGIDSVMRLFGVGASGIYEVSLSSTYEWLGTGSNPAIIGGAEALDRTNVFAQFSSVPADPHPEAKSLGFVTSTFSSADPALETDPPRIYISPIIDLGEAAPYLNAIEVVDYSPNGASINYFYKSAVSQEALANTTFAPIDLTLENNLENQVKARTAIIDQTINQYVRVKIELVNNTFTQRSAVYAVNFQYKPEAPVAGSLNQGGTAVTRNIAINYDPTGAPESADIDILSSNVNNSLVYSAQSINLAQNNQGYAFQANLAPGAYALTISAPQLNTRIIPFLVSNDDNITINGGSFTVSTGFSGNDLNGDGVVNSIDFLLLQQQSQ